MSTSPPTRNRLHENQWKIDPPIYPDSKLAMEVPAERYAYVAALDPDHKSHSDALLVVDVDPTSQSFGEVPERADLPEIGDELHHFGLERVTVRRCAPSLGIRIWSGVRRESQTNEVELPYSRAARAVVHLQEPRRGVSRGGKEAGTAVEVALHE
jgi:56kDa selenium binding protein (SBP56)